MFYVSGNELYIAGGNIYCEMQVKRHPITEILKLKIDMLTKKATVEKIQIEYGEDINMSSGTMTKKGNKL